LKKSAYPYEVEVTVKLTLKGAPDTSRGFLAMTLADCMGTIHNTDDNGVARVHGEAAAAIGGGIMLHHALTDTRYGCNLGDLWNALADKLDELSVPVVKQPADLPEYEKSE